MNIQRQTTGIKTVGIIMLGAAMVHGAYADGYRNPPPTAAGIAKSGAHSVFVDDASAISYNPANLALQTNVSIVVDVTLARTENTYVNPHPLYGGSFESDGDWNYLPNLYYSHPVGDNGLAFGLGITTPYGQGISWNQSEFTPFAAPSNTVPYEAAVMMIDINPTVAFKVADSVSIGVGLDIYYSELQLKAVQGLYLPPPVDLQLFLDTEGEGSGWGVGANLGLTWLTTEGQRLALTYRSGFEIDYSGDFKVSGTGAGDFETTVKYPNTIGVGYGVELTDAIQVEALVEWLQWSVNDSQTMQAGSLGTITIQNNWEDTFTFGLGGSWDATDWLIVRAGYAFLPSPIPDETITPLLPDADRHALSFGLGFAFADHHMIDLAYTYSIYSDRAAPVTGASPGTYDIDSNLVGLTYSFSF